MAFEFDCNGLLDIGIKAKLRTFNGTGLDADKIAVVYYEVPLGAGAGCIDWLKGNRKTVRDVQIDFQMLSGTWRSAGIVSEQSTKNKEMVTIVQTFKYGWIQSLVSGTTVDWSEARYVRGNESAEPTVLGEYPVTDPELNPQQYHLVKWEGIDPLKLDAVRSELRDLTPSAWSPTVNGESLGTGFFLLDVIAETGTEQDQDRSGTLTALIAKPRFNLQAWELYGTPGQAKIYYLFDVPMYLAQALINTYNERTGATVTATAPDERFLVSLTVRDKADSPTDETYVSDTSCQYYSVTTFYSGLAAVPDVPDNAMGITYRSRFDFIRTEGTFIGTIEKRIRQTQHVPARYTEEGHGTYTVTERWEGLYKTATNTYKSRTSTVADPLAALVDVTGIPLVTPASHIAPGIIRRVTETENEDCTSNIIVELRYSEEVDPAVDGEAHTRFEDTDTSGKRNAVAPEAGVSVSGGKITEVSSQKNEFGLWDTRKTERTGVEADDAVKVKQIDAFGAVDSDTDRNKTTAIAEETTQTPGRIKQTRSQLNDYGLYDNTEEIRTSTEQADFAESASHNAFDKEATAQSRNLVAEPTLPTAQTPGQVKRLMKRLNEFLRWDSEETTQTAEVQAAAGASKTVQKFVVEANAEARNLVAEPVLEDTQTPGIIKTIQKRLNLFLRWDKQEQTRTAVEVDDAQKSKQISKFETVVSDTDRNKADAIVEETTQTAGKIKQTRNTVNDFGLNDHETQERTAAEVDDVVKSKQIDKFTKQTSVTDRNQSTAIAEETTQTAGTIKQTRSQLNEFGLYENTEDVRESIEQSDTGGTSGATVFETQDGDSARNLAVEPEPDAFEVGKIKQFRKSLNEFGRWDKDGTERVAVEVPDTGGQSSGTTFETVDGDSARNLVLEPEPDATEAGKIKSFRKQLNDFGRWDKDGTERTAITVTDAQTAETEAKYETQESDTIRNAATARTVTAEIGKIKTHRVEKSEFPDRVHDTIEVRIAVEVDDAQKTKQITAFETVASEVDRNKAAAITEETVQTPGQIKQTRNSVNDFALNDHETQVRTATEDLDAGTAIGGNEFEVRKTTVTRSTSDDVDVGTTLDIDATAGTITEVKRDLNEFGLVDTQETERKVTPKTVRTEDYNKSETPFEKRKTESKVNAISRDEYPAFEAGKQVELQNTLNEFGRYDVNKVTREAVEDIDAAKGWLDTRYETRESTTTRNTDAGEDGIVDIVEVDAANIKITEVSGELNDMGLVDKRVVERTGQAIDDIEVSKTVMPFEIRKTNQHVNRLLAEDLPDVQVPGFIKEVRNKINEFGRIDVSIAEREATLDTGGAKGWLDTVYETRETTETRNKEAGAGDLVDIVEVDEAEGIITEVRGELNEFGLVDEREVKRTAKDADWSYSSEQQAFRETDVEIERNAAEVMTAEPVEGKIVRVQSSKNEFGKYDNQKEVITPITVPDMGDAEVDTQFENRNTVLKGNQDDKVAPVAVADGKITDVQNRLNEFGKWDTQKTVRQSKTETVSDELHNVGETLFEKRKSERKINQLAETPVPARADGFVVEVQNQLNEYGRIDSVKQTRESSVVEDSARETTIDFFKKTIEETDRNLVASGDDEAIFTIGSIKVRQYQKNEFGRFDEKHKTLIAADPEDSDWITIPTRSGDMLKKVFYNQTLAQVAAIAAELEELDGWGNQLTNSEMSFSADDFGLWSGTATKAPVSLWNGYFFVSTKTTSRTSWEYDNRLAYVPESGDKFEPRPHKRERTIYWRTVYTESYASVISAMEEFFEYEGEGNLTLIDGPSVSRVTDENGRYSYFVQARYAGLPGDWELIGDPP